MRHWVWIRLTSMIVPLAAALLIAAQPAAAHVTMTSGSPGNYVVTDTTVNPGAHCFYYDTASSTDLYKIKIRPPKMFAKNRTAGVDSQKVGWQFWIQHGTSVGSNPTGWATSFKSSIVKATAFDNQAAAFSARTWNASANINRWWRVKLLLYWYKPGTSTMISGQVNDIIDYYTYTYPPGPDTVYPTDCIPDE